MKKRMIGLMLAFTMAASLLGGCAGAPLTSEDAADSGAAGEGSGEGLKIAIVSSPSGVDDGSFNQNNYEGVLAFIAENPDATVTPVKEATGDAAASLQRLPILLRIMM